MRDRIYAIERSDVTVAGILGRFAEMTDETYVNQENRNTAAKTRSVPDLLRKEALAAFLALILLLLLSAVWDAPTEGPADPGGMPAEDVKAPWIFVGIQQMLRYLPPFLAGVFIPLVVLLALGLVPLMPARFLKITRAAFFGIVAAFAILTVWGYFR